MQAIMAAAKQQHRQHMADTQSHLQEAIEATQHAQAAELAVDSRATEVKADKAAAAAAANRAEATLQQFKGALAAAEHDRANTTQQHAANLKHFILSTVDSAVPVAVRHATAGLQYLSQTARDARGMLEGVRNEICRSMQAAGQPGQIEERLMRVESAIANSSQSGTALAGPGLIRRNQVVCETLSYCSIAT